MRSSRGDSNLLSRRDFFERKGLWNVMGLHYTVNNSTSKKFLALGSSFWRGLNFLGMFLLFFVHPTSVKKRLTLCDGGVRTCIAVQVLLSQLVVRCTVLLV